MLLLLERVGGVICGHLLTAVLRAYGPARLLRPEQGRYLQVQLFRLGQVSDLAERLTPARGGDAERLASFLAATRPPPARMRGPASAAGCIRTVMAEHSSGSRYRFTAAGGPLCAGTSLIRAPAGSYVQHRPGWRQ
jgi:hypothetical protein